MAIWTGGSQFKITLRGGAAQGVGVAVEGSKSAWGSTSINQGPICDDKVTLPRSERRMGATTELTTEPACGCSPTVSNDWTHRFPATVSDADAVQAKSRRLLPTISAPAMPPTTAVPAPGLVCAPGQRLAAVEGLS